MGMYDTYGPDGFQLKVGPCLMVDYQIGDSVPIEDGVYIALEGVVVVIDGKLAATFNKATTKWGEELNISEIINDEKYHPVMRALNGLREKEAQTEQDV